jgi:hypothetical protein
VKTDNLSELRRFIDRTTFSINLTCPKCHNHNSRLVRLAEIPVRGFQPEPPEPLEIECMLCKTELLRLLCFSA